jgi:YD repeat-containing protein
LGAKVSQDFDLDNMVGTITDAKNNITLLLYDERGNVLEENRSAGQYDLLRVHRSRDTRTWRRRSPIAGAWSSCGGTTRTGNQTQVTYAAGTDVELTTTFTYVGDKVTSIKQADRPPIGVQVRHCGAT